MSKKLIFFCFFTCLFDKFLTLGKNYFNFTLS